MKMTHRLMSAPLGAAALLAASAGLATSALAADLDPTTQAGQYAAQVSVVQVKGNPIPGFADSTVWVPFMLDGPNALINATLVENVNGSPLGFVTSFDTDPLGMGDRTATVLGTTDAADGVSNNVLVREPDNRSDSPGGILPDGTIAYMARFSGMQNNIDVFTGITGVLPQTAAPEPISAGAAANGSLVFSSLATGASGSSETGLAPETNDVLGAVFIGTPGIARDPSRDPMGENDDLLFGHTSFNGFPGLFGSQVAASVNGVNVYAGFNNDPRSGCTLDNTGCPNPEPAGAHVGCWRQPSVPLPTNPPGETSNDARQTQPALTLVTTPSGAQVIYAMHGIGFSGGTPFTGSNFNPMYFAVDTLRFDYASGSMTPEENTIIIEADAVGGVGAQHGFSLGFDDDVANTDPNQRFVDHGATGGAAEVSTTSQFDMNANGYVALIHQDRNAQPTSYEVRIYEPIWNLAEDRIVGFNLAAIPTFSGDMDSGGGDLIPSVILDTDATFMEFSVNPFSGVALDDNNRASFVGVTEVAQREDDYDRDEEFLPPELATPRTNALLGQTTALFVYDLGTDTLHKIIEGGGGDAGNGDPDITDGTILTPLAGSPTDERLMVGSFGFNNTTDSFCRDSFARDGSYVAVSFRSSNNFFENSVETEFDTVNDFNGLDGTVDENYTDRGGLLFLDGQLGANERNVRGSLIIELGDFDPGAPVCCPGNAAKESPGSVNFADITAVLGNWLGGVTPANPDGSTSGDANCDGAINFADITEVLGNWLSQCP